MRHGRINIHSEDWLLVQTEVSKLLAQAEKQLKNDQSEGSTATLRGRIRAFEQVLSLPSRDRPADTEPLGFETGHA